MNHSQTTRMPYKAPGRDGIPNCVCTNCRHLLTRLLLPLFRATFNLKYSTTHKPGKIREPWSYVSQARTTTAPKAYRLIVLLNVMSKLLSACVAERINTLAESHHLLPDHHFGDQTGRTTTDSMHAITSFIKKAWRAGKCLMSQVPSRMLTRPCLPTA
jgi:hypothetical protein